MTHQNAPEVFAPWPSELPKGLHLQLYVDSHSVTALKTMVAVARELKMKPMFHCGPLTMQRKLSLFTSISQAAGVEYGLAFGLDALDLSIQRKGELIADSIIKSGSKHNLMDAESRWENPNEAGMNDAGALQLGKVVRSLIGQESIVGDQPWFAIEQHGGRRRTPLALDSGGVFAGFPSDEFAQWVNYRATQLYFRDSKSPRAYQGFLTQHFNEWAEHEETLATVGLVRPRTFTLQGYGHKQRPFDFVDALLRCRDRSTVIWWDYEFRSTWQVTAACIRAFNLIVDRGFAPAGKSPKDAVRDFQKSVGLKPEDCDGSCGWITMLAAKIVSKIPE